MTRPTQYGLQFLNAEERPAATRAKESVTLALDKAIRPKKYMHTVRLRGADVLHVQKSTADGFYKDVPGLVWSPIEKICGVGSYADPLGGQLLREWRTGTGPDIRYHSPRSAFSDEFKNATSTMEYTLKIWEYWINRKASKSSPPPLRLSGSPACHVLTNAGMSFGIWQYMMSGRSAQVMGSVTMNGVRYLPATGNTLWTCWNIMGTGSFMAGHIRRQLGWDEPATLRRPGAFGATRHIIQWYSDVPSWVRARAA
jgi:hypothetical protein